MHKMREALYEHTVDHIENNPAVLPAMLPQLTHHLRNKLMSWGVSTSLLPALPEVVTRMNVVVRNRGGALLKVWNKEVAELKALQNPVGLCRYIYVCVYKSHSDSTSMYTHTRPFTSL